MDLHSASSAYFDSNYVALGSLFSSETTGLAYSSDEPLDGWRALEDIKLNPVNQNQGQYLKCPSRLEHDVQYLVKTWRIKVYARVLQNIAVHRVYILNREANRPNELMDLPEMTERIRQLHIWPASHLARVLPHLNVSRAAWEGNSETDYKAFDPWATSEEGSLFYIFNTLPSPSPDPREIKNTTAREAVQDLLDYSTPIAGLKTRLYPYQARSAAQMIQKESCVTTRLDPRFESRVGPDGKQYYYSPRDVSISKSPSIWDSSRGGILAETMGLGKTVICLAVILLTRDHLPQIPPYYDLAPMDTESVPSLMQVAFRSCARHSIPVKPELRRLQRLRKLEYSSCLRHWRENPPAYLIPGKPPRSLRKVTIPPPKKMTLSAGTIIVVPRNLVHQWKAELRKHLVPGPDALSVLIMDDLHVKIPSAEELQRYDILLFSKQRFEREAIHGSELRHRREIVLGGDYRPVEFFTEVYQSPLKSLHFLRLIIDEGHQFSSPNSDAVLVAERIITAERRWVVSGTPARDKLYGVEVDLAGAMEIDEMYDQDQMQLEDFSNEVSTPLESDHLSMDAIRNIRASELARRKAYNQRQEMGTTSPARSLGLLVRHFLKINPWFADVEDGNFHASEIYRHGTVWDEHIYRHEDFAKKTYKSFSVCLRQTLQSLVIKTRPEDVDRDIVLPPLYHKVVRLEPSFYDKLTANLFVLFLTANAITSERTDVDYLFHPKSFKERRQLVNNLRQSNFFWTGFDHGDVASVMRTGTEYLNKQDSNCTQEDRMLLETCLEFAKLVSKSAAWSSMHSYHEVGLFLDHWPEDGMAWTMTTDSKPPMIGLTQLINAQSYVNDRLFAEDPFAGLESAGRELMAVLESRNADNNDKKTANGTGKIGLPTSGIKSEPLASKYRTLTPKKKPRAQILPHSTTDQETVSPVGKKKRGAKTVSAEESASPQSAKKPSKSELDQMHLPKDSPLLQPAIIGTVSAKLSYLMDRIVEFHATEKIIVFYDGENAAFYLAQCLELLHVKFLIYSRRISHELKSRYIVTFDADPTIRVLLMDIESGAHGLNVNKASRVFFINPVCRPSTEAQAIKRAHRIGQTKPVYVETLVLNGTIEAGMFERSKRMTQAEHLEAMQLSDDKGVAEVIQNAKLLPITLEDGNGFGQMALLNEPVQVFGRKGRGTMMKIKGIDKDEEMDIFGIKQTKKRARKNDSDENGRTMKKRAEPTTQKDEAASVKPLSGVEWMNIPLVLPPKSDDIMETENSLFG